MKFFIEKINKTVEVQIVNQWVSPKGEEYVTLEYFNPEYNINECNSFPKAQVLDFQETPKNGHFEEW